MSIIIKGVSLPTDKYLAVRIYPDGAVVRTYTNDVIGRASELPPHGDLIDRDAFECISYKGTEGRADTFDDGVLWLLDQTDEMPVIVPAERREET